MNKPNTVKDLFYVVYGVNLELINLEVCQKNDPNSIRFISRTEKSNGLSAYVKQVDDYEPNPAHTISVAASGSVLSSFYQDEEYYSGRDLYYLQPIEPMTKAEMLFYAFCISQNKYKYNYGRAANRTLKDIVIPAKKEIPNWVYTLNPTAPEAIKASDIDTVQLNPKEWQWFDVNRVFTIKKGKRLTEADQTPGNIPYVSSSSFDNGVNNFISNGYTDENCLSFACYGCIGEVFYQLNKSWVSDNCNVFYLQNRPLTVYIAMFLITILKQEQFRFSYGMTGKKERLESFKIKLPAINGNPDWDFMESYIKSLPYSATLTDDKFAKNSKPTLRKIEKAAKGLSDEELIRKYDTGEAVPELFNSTVDNLLKSPSASSKSNRKHK